MRNQVEAARGERWVIAAIASAGARAREPAREMVIMFPRYSQRLAGAKIVTTNPW